MLTRIIHVRLCKYLDIYFCIFICAYNPSCVFVYAYSLFDSHLARFASFGLFFAGLLLVFNLFLASIRAYRELKA